MHRTYQAYSPRGPPLPPSQQNKVILQREYREREGDCFNTLRGVIKELTGDELRTRQEILRKAIDILLTASEMRQQSKVQADTLSPYETPTPTKPEDTTSVPAYVGYFTQPPHYPESWQSSAEFDAGFSYYAAHVHNQQYHFVSSPDSTFNPASFMGYGEDLSGYSQF